VHSSWLRLTLRFNWLAASPLPGTINPSMTNVQLPSGEVRSVEFDPEFRQTKEYAIRLPKEHAILDVLSGRRLDSGPGGGVRGSAECRGQRKQNAELFQKFPS
jgi:hypothetical protein